MSVAVAAAPTESVSPFAAAPPEAVTQAPPALTQALREVWARNPAVQAAEAKAAAAEARSQAAARPLYNPEIEVAAERADVNTRSVGLSQTIDWSGKRRARVGVGTAEWRAAEAERDQIRQDIGLQWLSGCAAYQVATEQVSLGNERVRILGQFASLAQRRFTAGDIPSLERDLAELALQEARAQQAELLADQAQARRTLAAVGGDATALPELPRALPPEAQVPVAISLIDALPALRQVRAESEAAQARITVAERERRADPTVSVSTGRVTDGPLRDNLLGVTLRIPLFVRNSYRAEVTAARADADQAEAAVRDRQLRATAEANEAGAAYNAMRDAWLQWEASRASRVADRAALLQRLWEAGELSTADYLVQLKQSIDTELTATGLRARVWQAWADWLAATGHLAPWLGAALTSPTDKE
ncbi:TolC family protein [Tahibacter aquaticus]|uniref:TolC family protein n=1 Tax=Tahibacter aquaticus TaxID=520092 RepID=UPI001414DFE4|nr:TolC family protein [Tahibacter aquaticus]